MTSDDDVVRALGQLRDRHGQQVASVVHLAAYYDFSGEPSPLYEQLTVQGTARLLRELKRFETQQFVFSSSLLVMQSAEDGQLLTPDSPIDAEWAYPQSKLRAERVIAQQRGQIPAVILRIAGVYDEDCHSLPIAQQISRIYEKQLESYLFPGDKTHGQAFVHLDDLVECIRLVIERRASLQPYEVLLIAEDDVMSYEELQEAIGEQLHGRAWPTIRIPKTLAKMGAWVKEKIASGDEDAPFIRPWMIDLADQNYPVDIRRARQLLGWQPQHTLRATLPIMIKRLLDHPQQWYEENHLPSEVRR